MVVICVVVIIISVTLALERALVIIIRNPIIVIIIISVTLALVVIIIITATQFTTDQECGSFRLQTTVVVKRCLAPRCGPVRRDGAPTPRGARRGSGWCGCLAPPP